MELHRSSGAVRAPLVVLLPEVGEVEVLDAVRLGLVPSVGRRQPVIRLDEKEQNLTVRLRHGIHVLMYSLPSYHETEGHPLILGQLSRRQN